MEKYIAGIFGLGLGIGGIIVSFMQLRNFSGINHWKMTRGKVIERGTVESQVGKLRAPGIKYEPLVRYSYQVGGKDFINAAIYPKHMLGYAAGSTDWAKKESEKFADEVTLFYNPENPAESFLRFPPKNIYYIVGGVSLLVALYGIFVLFFWR